MSKAAYPYPADEFDAQPDAGAPRGVHRAPRSAWSRWWPFLLVIVLVPLLAWGAVTWMSNHGGLPNLAVPAVTETPAESPSAAESGAATASAPASTAPSSAPASPPASSSGTVDKATPVKVLNASGLSGAAATAATKLTKAGFTSVTTGNSPSSTKQSVVYYATAAQQQTAALAASTLGISTVTLSAAQAGTGITVVLG
ncbi:LytR C-terminal domain-containing protein [Cellulomonas sp. NTE-D12]|uniref:LytR C-terminal domain-containing protein n=1 Tax=Cellulomonas sp. NTE-D12 TaxID=2962632 RepID=UPI0030819989|nr:hypothetical protein CELD12_05350 [Cellulomonas sp. NTE-D12]